MTFLTFSRQIFRRISISACNYFHCIYNLSYLWPKISCLGWDSFCWNLHYSVPLPIGPSFFTWLFLKYFLKGLLSYYLVLIFLDWEIFRLQELIFSILHDSFPWLIFLWSFRHWISWGCYIYMLCYVPIQNVRHFRVLLAIGRTHFLQEIFILPQKSCPGLIFLLTFFQIFNLFLQILIESMYTLDGVLFFSIGFFLLLKSFLGFFPFGLIFLQELTKRSQFTLQIFIFDLDIILSRFKLSLLTTLYILYSLNSYFFDSNCSWISYIFLLFYSNFVAGETVSYWLKTGNLLSFFMKKSYIYYFYIN